MIVLGENRSPSDTTPTLLLTSTSLIRQTYLASEFTLCYVYYNETGSPKSAYNALSWKASVVLQTDAFGMTLPAQLFYEYSSLMMEASSDADCSAGICVLAGACSSHEMLRGYAFQIRF